MVIVGSAIFEKAKTYTVFRIIPIIGSAISETYFHKNKAIKKR
jgi:hypothetical protein